MVLVFSQAVVGAIAICIPHCDTYVLLAVALSLIGLTAGFTGSVRLLITTEVTGREKCKEGFSMLNLIIGIVFSVGSPLFGVSLGMTFFTGQIIAGFYFEKKRALAIGISNCGGGMGILVGNMLIEYFIEFYGPRGTLLLISGALLNIVVFGSLCRPLQYAYKNVEQKESIDGTNQTSVMEDEESHNTGITRERRIRNERFIKLKETQNVSNKSVFGDPQHSVTQGKLTKPELNAFHKEKFLKRTVLQQQIKMASRANTLSGTGKMRIHWRNAAQI
ncbi:Hypothetical predicted protein [Octopus vulgaris]|uniref:Uncharacterized protein n=1 Tax=Octopus vulgaris TaxID=6645 RepID=A0AA36BMP1_OCTVU|nr:Hypothetical predicted protein [Octopus vulgaris]